VTRIGNPLHYLEKGLWYLHEAVRASYTVVENCGVGHRVGLLTCIPEADSQRVFLVVLTPRPVLH
jgi:hypothetical protein